MTNCPHHQESPCAEEAQGQGEVKAARRLAQPAAVAAHRHARRLPQEGGAARQEAQNFRIGRTPLLLLACCCSCRISIRRLCDSGSSSSSSIPETWYERDSNVLYGGKFKLNALSISSPGSGASGSSSSDDESGSSSSSSSSSSDDEAARRSKEKDSSTASAAATAATAAAASTTPTSVSGIESLSFCYHCCQIANV